MISSRTAFAIFGTAPLLYAMGSFGQQMHSIAAEPNATTNRTGDDQAKVEFFETKIRPVLIDRCYACHSSKTVLEGNLGLDSQLAIRNGGDRGPVVVPGDAANSLLMQAIRWSDPEIEMPPAEAGNRLSEQQIADFESWINNGAFDPRTDETAISRKSWDEKFQERLDWWSLRPIERRLLPKNSDTDWNSSSIDSFLRDAMRQQDVVPAQLAEPRTLIRRATLVLTGLPPKPSDVDSFVTEYASEPDKAYAAMIDRLLTSDAFGERFCKHWLDVVRFTETHGNEWNYDVPYAYRYRDYMIRAINSDLPYDQWIREHIAGDLLPHPRWNAQEKFNESAIGTAFYRFGEVNHDSCTQFPIIGYDIVDNQVDTLSKAFLATTVSCARCHDHKLDAISTKDYHAFLGIMRSSRSVQRTINDPDTNQLTFDQLREIKNEVRTELIRVWNRNAEGIQEASIRKALETLKDNPPTIEHPLWTWIALEKDASDGKELFASWNVKAEEFSKEAKARKEFNTSQFELLYDFRDGIPNGWSKDGLGLREPQSTASDLVVAHEGDAAIKLLLPRGVYTCLLSDKMNGALRSPVLPKSIGKISFEVLGGNFSLARVVCNNCQLNYDLQHSIHHPEWSWVTVNVPIGTDVLYPYAELLTYWDNPKFPDPLGTLGKDTENQRLPFNDHAKNPRTWFGIRRIVAHREAVTPKDDLTYLHRLFDGSAPSDLQQLADRFRRLTHESLERFAEGTSSDDDVRWLDAMLKLNFLENRSSASTALQNKIDHYREVEIHELTLPTTMPGMADEWDGFAQPVLARGDYTKPGETVPRRFLQALDKEGATVVERGSGRAMLAESIANKSNPLTARVMVNRVWHWCFGQGLVLTPDDFGHLGDLPSHPELLDQLSIEFMEEGWSFKKLVRKIVMSRAFRTSSVPSVGAREIDPQNRLLSHYPARRSEAEVIRDSLLAVSGRLDAKLFGPSVHPFREKADTDKRLYTGPIDGDGRRSLYLKVQLMEAPRFLSAFNLPGGKVTQGRRDTSNVPAQSLAMLNDPFVWAMSEQWAKRLLSDGRATIADRIESMFRDALGRPPTDTEKARFVSATIQFAKVLIEPTIPSDSASAGPDLEGTVMASESVWQNMAHAMFNIKEFIYVP